MHGLIHGEPSKPPRRRRRYQHLDRRVGRPRRHADVPVPEDGRADLRMGTVHARGPRRARLPSDRARLSWVRLLRARAARPLRVHPSGERRAGCHRRARTRARAHRRHVDGWRPGALDGPDPARDRPIVDDAQHEPRRHEAAHRVARVPSRRVEPARARVSKRARTTSCASWRS